MPDPNALALDRSQGDRLPREAYLRDFRQRRAETQDQDSWKFERRQHFEEQNDPSRDALRRGDWKEALRLLEEERRDRPGSVPRAGKPSGTFYRVRVVEEPLTPYLQWELHALRIQAEHGARIRVVPADRVTPLEPRGLLPEVVVVGDEVLYEVIYTETGVPDGAVRFTDAQLIRNWQRFMKHLYADGEDVVSYVDRYVAHLPAPELASE
jgi:hypothetical protein